LRYQTTCDVDNRWYQGNQTNWSTSLQTGCPDAHVHVARTLTSKNLTVRDGVQAVVTATYSDNSMATSSQNIYFTPLVNLPPNSTSFISPAVGNVYSEGPINISWNPATDPNNDSLLYSIYLLDSSGATTSTLVTATTSTSFNWGITDLTNGQYSLKGVITEATSTPLSTEFFLGGHFTINQAVTLYSLSNIYIGSNNASSTLAKTGDTITLSFSSSGPIDPSVMIYSGDTEISSGRINIASSTTATSTDFIFTYNVQESDDDGLVSFEISASNLDQIYNNTTNYSFVTIDNTLPATAVASPGAGTYSSSQNISLSSVGADSIRYTINGSDPSCSSGTLYAGAIAINAPTTIKAIACDLAGNNSDVASFVYNFQYTLTYTAGAGGTITGTSTQTVSYGLNGTVVTAVPNTGYSFVKWSDNSTANPRTDINVTSNISVTAEFAINQYTLTYNAGSGGTITGTSTQIVNYGSNGTAVTAVPDTGYSFVKWSDESTVNPRTDINVEGDVTVTAEFAVNQYTLTYTAGAGGTITGTSTQIVIHGSSGSEVTAVPDSGYHFISWSDGILTASRTDINVSTNITVTANFAINSSVTLNYTAGVGGVIIGSSTQVFAADLNGTTVMASSSPGYTFLKWSDESTANPRTDLNVQNDIFVTAIFIPNIYTLTFNPQGGVVSQSTTTVTFASAVGALPSPTRTGYTFNGWYTELSGGTQYTSTTTYQIAGDLNLYAQWTINQYTLTFNSAGGSTVAPITGNYGTDITTPTTTRTGYTFTTWNPTIPATMPASNQAHTAQWTANPYTLTFNPQGGVVSSSTKTVIFDTAVGVLPIPTRTGHSFTGWYTASSGGTQYASTTTYQIASDLTLHAQWTANTYLIAFNTQGGSSAATILVTYNSAVGSLPSPTKTGHTFAGWYTEANGLGVNYINSTPYLLTENIVLIAKWTPNLYTLTFNSTGGSAVSSINQNYATAITSPANPSRIGYTFNGWNPALPTTMPASNQTHTAQWLINQYTLAYSAGVNGVLTGDTSQTLDYNLSGTAITAIADDGYRFVRWSDDSTANPRTDININANLSVSAIFEKIPNSASGNISLPPGIGPGSRDAALVSNVIGATLDVGQITDSGVNVLTYITNQNKFIAPQSSNNWQASNHHFVINDLNLNSNIVTLIFYSEPKTVILAKGETKDLDLDNDGVNDIRVTFTNVYVNRAEITIKSLENSITPSIVETPPITSLNLKEVMDRERALVKKTNSNLVNRLNGHILLQVEEKGQAWYLEPVTKQKHFMGRADDAFSLMRKFGLGITNTNLDKFLAAKAPSKFSGRIFLAVERNGEAYYVNPVDLKLYYLGRPADAYQMMRDLALGVSNDNIRHIPVAEVK